MKQCDVSAMLTQFPFWVEDLQDIDEVLILSPSPVEENIIHSILPRARIYTRGKNGWDVCERPAPFDVDVTLVANVLFYVEDPATAFRNILTGCRELWLQDLVSGKRGPEYFGDDGDTWRFSYGNVQSDAPHHRFDLQDTGRVTDFRPYPSVPGTGTSFLARLRGDLSRIDRL